MDLPTCPVLQFPKEKGLERKFLLKVQSSTFSVPKKKKSDEYGTAKF